MIKHTLEQYWKMCLALRQRKSIAAGAYFVSLRRITKDPIGIKALRNVKEISK